VLPPVLPLPRPSLAKPGSEEDAPVELRPSTGRAGKPVVELTTGGFSDEDLPRILRPDPSRSAIGIQSRDEHDQRVEPLQSLLWSAPINESALRSRYPPARER